MEFASLQSSEVLTGALACDKGPGPILTSGERCSISPLPKVHLGGGGSSEMIKRGLFLDCT